MIAFASLFLGLITGLEPVELLVGDPVAAIGIRLDGRVVGELRGEPWSLICDFGPELEPHELEAVAYDAGGKELARVRQWVNVPRDPAEASVVLEGGDKGRGVVARLTWTSVVAAQPLAVQVSFDGKVLAFDDLQRIELPAHDPRKLHFLRVELDFARNVSSVVEVVFDGTYAETVAIHLTAVPVILERRRRLPSVSNLQGRFSKNRRPLTVVATEDGPAEVLLVRDEGIRRILSRLGRTSEVTLRRRARSGNVGFGGSGEPLRYRMILKGAHQIRFLWPFSESQGLGFDLLSPSPPFSPKDGGIYWLLTDVSAPYAAAEEQRLADAVAVAGLLAAGRNRRRAVVLILGAETDDSSIFDPAAVRRYLEYLHVPLVIWSPEPVSPAASGGWGPTVDISSLRKLDHAAKDLGRMLDRQRIVWLDGIHLPHDIVLEPGSDLRLAR